MTWRNFKKLKEMKTFIKYAILAVALIVTMGAILSVPKILRVQAMHRYAISESSANQSAPDEEKFSEKAVSERISVNFSQSDMERAKLPQRKNSLKEKLERDMSTEEEDNGYFSMVSASASQARSSAPVLTKAEKKRIEDKRDREETWAYSNAEDYIDETQEDMFAGDKVGDLEPEEETVEDIILGDKKNVKAYQYILGESASKADGNQNSVQDNISRSSTDGKVTRIVDTKPDSKLLFETGDQTQNGINFSGSSIFGAPNALSATPAIANYSVFNVEGDDKVVQKQLEAFNAGKQQRMADFSSFFAISPASSKDRGGMSASGSSQGSIFDMGGMEGTSIPYRLPSSASGDSLFKSTASSSLAMPDPVKESINSTLKNPSVRPIQRFEMRR